MDDGISINVASTAITALGSGGVGALLMHIFGGGRKKPARDCAHCPEHHELEMRVNRLEQNNAAQTALLQSIDHRLETLNNFMMRSSSNGR